MAEHKQSEAACTYASVKIDDQLLPLLKGAAGFADQMVQEYLSDLVNEVLAERLGRKPIKRRSPRKGK